MIQALRVLRDWLRENLSDGLEAIDAGPSWLDKQPEPSLSANAK